MEGIKVLEVAVMVSFGVVVTGVDVSVVDCGKGTVAIVGTCVTGVVGPYTG